MNVNLLDYTVNDNVSQFVDVFLSYNLYPTISRPTRISHNSNTLIDCIFTNDLRSIVSGVLVETLISDHFPIFMVSDLSDGQKCYSRNFVGRKFDPGMVTRLNQALSIAFNGFHDIDSPDDALERFCYEIESRVDLYFPKKTSNRKNVPLKPWITQRILDAINRKNSLYKIYVQTKTDASHFIFKTFRNRVLKDLRNAKKLYYQGLIEKNKGNSKRTWQILNEMLGRENHKSCYVKSLNVNGSLLTDEQQIASGLNEFFTSIGANLEQTIPISNSDPTAYIHDDIQDTCFLNPVSPVTVQNVLREMKASGGSEQAISAKVLKLISASISAPLSHVINLCFTAGYFPDKLKTSIVTPIHKSGCKDSAGNYRPISVLSPLSKIIERCASDIIINFLNIHDILGSNQYGFRLKHSTEHALINFVDYVTNEREKGNYVMGIYLDIRKAFDSVNYEILFKKLVKYGIRGHALNLIKSYLTNRKQCVKVENVKGQVFISDLSAVTCGVPQGSVLGPLLFLLYVNDLQNVSQLFHTITYADDTNLFMAGPQLETLCNTANAELRKLKEWFDCNRLCVNIAKTCFQLYTSKVYDFVPKLQINNEDIKREPLVKFLGVLVDEQLSFKPHIEYIARKVAIAIGFMYRGRDLMNREQLILIYNTLVLPHLSFSSIVWGINFVTNLNRLRILQKRAARVVLGLGYIDHVSHRFREIGISPLCELINLRCMVLIYKIKHGIAPRQMNHLIEWRIDDDNPHALRHRTPLIIPFSSRRFKQNTFRIHGPKLFNRLSVIADLNTGTSVSIFKKQVKGLLESNFG